MNWLLFGGIASSILGILIGGQLVFMIFCRERHAKITEAENSFWVRCGLVRPAIAAKIAKFEKGKGMRAIFAVEAILLLALGSIALFLHANPRRSQRVPPYATPSHQLAPPPTETPKNSNP